MADHDMAPIMNEYKWSFFWRRFLETLFGGLKLFSTAELSFSVRVFQLILYLVPLTWMIGCIALQMSGSVSKLFASLISLVASGIYFVVVAILGAILRDEKRKKSRPEAIDIAMGALAGEEEDLLSWSDPQTVKFLIPWKGIHGCFLCFFSSILLDAIVVWILDFNDLQSLFGTMSYLVIVLVIFTNLSSRYALIAHPPPEPSKFWSTDTIVMSSLNRSWQVISVFALALLTEVPEFYALWITLASVLPFLWCTGWVGQIDVSTLWALEQMQMFLFGGTASKSNSRLLISVVLSIVGTFILFLVASLFSNNAYEANGAPMKLLALGTGLFLAQNWIPFGTVSDRESDWDSSSPKRSLHIQWSSRRSAALVGTALAITLGGGVLLAPSLWFLDFGDQIWLLLPFSVVLLLLNVGRFLIVSARQPWSLLSCCCVGKKRGFLHRIFSLSTRWMSIVFVLISTQVEEVESSILLNALVLALLIRAFRNVFQTPTLAFWEVVITAFWRTLWVGMGMDASSLVFGPLSFFIVGFALHRVREMFLKLDFFIIMLGSIFKNKKHHFRNWRGVLCLELILLPIFNSIYLLSVVLSAPLLPAFGLPIVWMGFPRPLRSWPTSGTSFSRKREETPFYEFLSSKLARAVQDMQNDGALQNILPGSTFLFRNDPLLAWIEVIEVGYDYEIIVVKGLELQTTSCHAVEITHVDAMITAVEDQSLSKSQSFFSSDAFSYVGHTQIEAFVPSQLSLIGLVESAEFFDALWKYFLKALVHVFHRHGIDSKWFDNAPFSMTYLSSMHDFPESYHRLLGGSDSLKIEADISAISFPQAKDSHGTHDGGEGNPKGNTEASVLDSLDEELNEVLAFVEEVERGDDVGVGGVGKHRYSGRDPQAPVERHTHGTIDEKFTRLLIACLDGIRPDSSSPTMTPYRLKSLFNDRMVATSENSWITDDTPLRSRVLMAFRYSVKLAIDEISMIAPESDEELMEMLDSFDSLWYFGSWDDEEWWDSIALKKRNILFGIGLDEMGNMFARNDSIRPVTFHVCRLNGESIRGIWAQLNLELQYMTNDDDERYAIQAHKQLLRNITIHAAEPPLGYPNYAQGGIIRGQS